MEALFFITELGTEHETINYALKVGSSISFIFADETNCHKQVALNNAPYSHTTLEGRDSKRFSLS